MFVSQVRLSSGENPTGMGQYWVEWDLPADREVASFWRPWKTRYNPKYHKVEVRSSLGMKGMCYQNKYGVKEGNDTEYPRTSWFPHSVQSGDVCMGVGVGGMPTAEGCHGDAPASNTDWPNHSICRPAFLSVWLH